MARLDPKPDVPSTIRRLAQPAAAVPERRSDGPDEPAATEAGAEVPAAAEAGAEPAPPARPAPVSRPIVAPLAPERYRVQFTIGEDTEKKLRRLQQLLRREIPNGDPAVIFDRALDLLLARTESRKEGRSRQAAARGGGSTWRRSAPKARPLAPGSRRVPSATRRTVVPRDGGQCTFVAADGKRCTARVYLEYHHAGVAFARGGGPGAAEHHAPLPRP